jgi:hypothetical protein
VRTFKNLILLNWDDFALCGAVACGGFLLGEVLTVFIGSMDEEIDLLFGGWISLVITAVFITFIVASHAMVTFSMALRCSRTRRHALGLVLGLVGVETLFALGVTALLCLVERTALATLWLAVRGAVPDVFSPPWWVFLLSVPGGAVLGIIAGAILQRFGRRGFWGLWAAWMLGCSAPRFLGGHKWLTHGFAAPAMGVAVAVVAAALAWSVWSLLHASLR